MESGKKMPGICLNMIVKNETKVLGRLFRSVKDFIDYYVIVDTGSTDGTPEFIRQQMDAYGIEGEVHIREWVNFGANRDEALKLAYAGGRNRWALLIDADEELGCSDPGFFGTMQPGVTYQLEKRHDKMRYALPALIDLTRTRWQWQGALHECLVDLDGNARRMRCDDVWVIYHAGEGARSHGVSVREKFLRDAAVLEREVAGDPDNPRNRFYLAQSYRDAGELQAAYDNYRIRAGMSGWDQESYVAQFEAGRAARALGLPHGTVLEELLAAYDMRPTRAEPLHELAVHCRLRGRYGEAYLFAKMGAQIPCPEDTLFVHRDVYEWRLIDELSIASYWIGNYRESLDLCRNLLHLAENGCDISEENRRRIEENLAFAEAKSG